MSLKDSFILSDSSQGSLVYVKEIIGEEKEKLYLSQLGLIPNVFIKVLSKQKDRMIISVKNTRIAIDDQAQKNIIVTDEYKEKLIVTTLDKVPAKTHAIVKSINSTGVLKRKIMDMGITKNANITVRKYAPLGDPIEITVRGYELSLRKIEASSIEVLCEKSTENSIKITKNIASKNTDISCLKENE